MSERHGFINENTTINIDESTLKDNAENLIYELFIEHINNNYDTEIERKV